MQEEVNYENQEKKQTRKIMLLEVDKIHWIVGAKFNEKHVGRFSDEDMLPGDNREEQDCREPTEKKGQESITRWKKKEGGQ